MAWNSQIAPTLSLVTDLILLTILALVGGLFVTELIESILRLIALGAV